MKLFTIKIIYIVGLISLAIAKDEIKNRNNKDSRVLLKVENHEGIKVEKNIEREVQKVKPADDDDPAPPPPSDDGGNNDDDQAPPPTDDGNDDGDDVTSPTPTNCGTVIVKIVTDDYPAETSFEVVNLSGNGVMSGSGYTGQRQEYVKTGCLPYATYDLIMKDSYNDGMCCSYGNGSYELSVNGAVVKTGGQYGASETTRFSTSSGPSPTSAPGCLNVIVTITTDDYPEETTFKVVNQNGAEFMSGGPYAGKRTEYAKASCLSSSNTYTFSIFDAYSDGICCSYGNGSYKLAVDGALIKSGATYGASESTTFGASSPPTPTIDVLVKITTDDYPGETSFTVTNQGGAVSMEGGSYTGKQTTYTESKALSTSNQYTFNIFDSYNDGMCCNYGNGSYEVSVNGAVIKTGGQFGASESTPLSGQAPPPSDDGGNNDDDQAPPPTDDGGNNDDDQAQTYKKPAYTKP